MEYVYPAIFASVDEGGYVVSFPDLPGAYSQGDDLCEALRMAQSALTQWLSYLTEKKLDIPQASHIGAVKVDSNEFVNLIRAEVKDDRAVKRTISIPRWMDEKVTESGLSLSRVLQDALSDKFAS